MAYAKNISSSSPIVPYRLRSGQVWERWGEIPLRDPISLKRTNEKSHLHNFFSIELNNGRVKLVFSKSDVMRHAWGHCYPKYLCKNRAEKNGDAENRIE